MWHTVYSFVLTCAWNCTDKTCRRDTHLCTSLCTFMESRLSWLRAWGGNTVHSFWSLLWRHPSPICQLNVHTHALTHMQSCPLPPNGNIIKSTWMMTFSWQPLNQWATLLVLCWSNWLTDWLSDKLEGKGQNRPWRMLSHGFCPLSSTCLELACPVVCND